MATFIIHAYEDEKRGKSFVRKCVVVAATVDDAEEIMRNAFPQCSLVHVDTIENRGMRIISANRE